VISLFFPFNHHFEQEFSALPTIDAGPLHFSKQDHVLLYLLSERARSMRLSPYREGAAASLFSHCNLPRPMGTRVIVTSPSDEQLERLKVLGADDLINYRDTPEWGAAEFALTGGVGVDHVVEVGGAGTLGQSMIAARLGGHIGVLAGSAGPVVTMPIMVMHLRVIGISIGSLQHQRDIVAAINMIGTRSVMDKHFPLALLTDALRYQEAGAHFGKISIDI
jgi:NADPH:quinone reductase-like Zn-dependent oxidoreductase